MTNVPERAIANETSPAVVLRHLSTGFWISQAIAVAAALGIADHLQHGAKSCAELAPAVGVHAGALYRLLRGIASVGVEAHPMSHFASAARYLAALEFHKYELSLF